MTERERYLATVNHRKPDRLLFHFSVSPALDEKIRKSEGLVIKRIFADIMVFFLVLGLP